jgi:hypothetical protein
LSKNFEKGDGRYKFLVHPECSPSTPPWIKSRIGQCSRRPPGVSERSKRPVRPCTSHYTHQLGFFATRCRNDHTSPGTTPTRCRSCHTSQTRSVSFGLRPLFQKDCYFHCTKRTLLSGCNWGHLPSNTAWLFPHGRRTPIPPASVTEMSLSPYKTASLSSPSAMGLHHHNDPSHRLGCPS